MPDLTDNRVLSRLMLLQGTLDSMPGDESMSRFIVRGLMSVPGIRSVNVCVKGVVAEKNNLCASCNYRWGEAENNLDYLCKLKDHGNTKCFPIRTVERLYGFVVLSLNDTPEAFTPYETYLQNIVNVIAIAIDNKRQRQALETFNEQLQSEAEQRKRAEDKIKALLAEKELILKEVHHRIKNNMNVIMSLLAMQADALKNPEAVKSLQDASSRVRSMMVLYDKLYLSDNFKQYLSSLVDEIVGLFPNRKIVKVEKQINDFILDAKRLSTLGIIVTELLTNSMKYAFIGKKEGLITVSAQLEDKLATIIIKDNGNGIPEAIDFNNSSGFGMQLVDMLAKQLRGNIRIERQGGAKFILEFEV
jgi:two-component sensor histidine kinase